MGTTVRLAMIDGDGIQVLQNLVRFERSVMSAYDRALRSIEDRRLNEQIRRLREDHARRARALNELLRHYGVAPLPELVDLSDRVLDRLDDPNGPASVLATLADRQDRLLVRLTEALAHDLPRHVREIVKRFADDELCHRQAVQEALEWRVWEERPTVTP